MKYRSVLLALVALAGNLLSAAPHVEIGEHRLLRASLPEDSPAALRIYLPAGESLEHWHRLASVRILRDLQDPAEYLSGMAAIVAQSHPAARCQFLQNARTKELILDFVTFAPASAAQPVTEWNLLRARHVPGIGLVVYQYALRLYREDATTTAVINAERSAMTGAFENASFEEQP